MSKVIEGENSESAEGADDDPDSEASKKAAAKKAEDRKKALIIIGSAVVFVLGSLATVYLTGLLDPLLKQVAGGNDRLDMSVASFTEPKPLFVDLPDVMVNLNTSGVSHTYLKVKVTLELADSKDIERIEAMTPRIVDTFQVYLRELRAGDLAGASGIYRLRRELFQRVATDVRPVVVKDILFKEIMVQ